MDALIRYQPHARRRTLWQMGTDHAGIATQMLVERQLAEQGIARREMGREAFVDKVWEWRENSGNTITQQIRRMGSSLDWSRDRFTMDDGYATAVLTVFERLFDEKAHLPRPAPGELGSTAGHGDIGSRGRER